MVSSGGMRCDRAFVRGPKAVKCDLAWAGVACEWRVIIARAAQSGGAGDRLVGGGWGPSQQFCSSLFLSLSLFCSSVIFVVFLFSLLLPFFLLLAASSQEGAGATAAFAARWLPSRGT